MKNNKTKNLFIFLIMCIYMFSEEFFLLNDPKYNEYINTYNCGWLLRIVLLILVFAFLLVQKMHLKSLFELVIALSLILLGFHSYCNMFLLVLVLFSIRNSSVKLLYHAITLFLFCYIITILLFYALGVIQSTSIVQDYGDYVRIRGDFGFQSYSYLPWHFLMLVMLIYHNCEKQVNYFISIVVIAISLYIYYITDTNTFFILTILYLIMYYCFNNSNRSIPQWTLFIPLVTFLISLFVALNYDDKNNILLLINNNISGRFFHWKNTFNIYDIKFFGNIIPEFTLYNTKEILVVDNNVLHLLIENGIFACVAFILSYTYLFYYAKKTKDMKLTIMLIIIMINAFLWNKAFNIVQVPILMLVCTIFYDEKEKEQIIRQCVY